MKGVSVFIHKIILSLAFRYNNLTIIADELLNKFFVRLFIDSSKKPKKSKLKIAYVKQDVYQFLYSKPNDNDLISFINSSPKHTGCWALFTEFETDFIVLKTEETKECSIWKEKTFDCNLGLKEQDFKDFASKPFATLSYAQSSYSKKADTFIFVGIFGGTSKNVIVRT